MKITHVLLFSALTLASCGKKTDDIVDNAGETVGKQIGNFTSSVGEGVDKEMMIKVTLSKDVLDAGITSTTAKRRPISDSNKGISVYLIASKDVNTTLRAIALNSDGHEIGRSKLPVKLESDGAGYFVFEFDNQMDSMTVKEYKVDIKKD